MTTTKEPNVREKVKQVVDNIPDSELHAALRYLEYLRDQSDPLIQSLLDAPEDDEPTTPEQVGIIEEGWQEYRDGKGVSLEDMGRELQP